MQHIIFYAVISVLSIVLFFLYYRFRQLQNIVHQAKNLPTREEEMFHNATLPMVYYKDNEYVGNKAFKNAFGDYAKDVFKALKPLPKYGEHTLELIYDNAVQKTSLIYLSTLKTVENLYCDFIATIVDISQLKQRKETLLTQKERFEKALESSDQCVWDWDIQNDTVVYSSQWRQIMGYSDNEPISSVSAWLNMVHSKDMALVNEKLRAHLDGRDEKFIIEHRVRQSDPLRWVKVEGRAIRNENNQAIRMVGTLQDTTKLKENQRNDTLEKERFVTFFNTLPTLSYIKNEEKEYVHVNLAFQKYIGFHSWLMRRASHLFDTRTAEALEEIDRLTRYEGQYLHTIDLPKDDGTYAPIVLYTFVIDIEGKKYICGVGVNKSFKL